MRFWDASAIVPLLLQDAATATMMALLNEDAVMLVRWGTPVECASALARLERGGALSLASAAQALARLKALSEGWQEILPETTIRSTAQRLLRVHPLRAADSLQLAAAVIAAEHEPGNLDFVCLDERLSDAAGREGLALPTTIALPTPGSG